MANIRQVAELAGVSVATVSRALTSPEKVTSSTLARVQQAIETLNYRPNLLARNFRTARSSTLVVLVPDITNPFFSQVIQAIEDRALQKGYAVLLGDTRESEKREQDYVNRVETRLADGLIQLRPQPMSSLSANLAWVNACGSGSTPKPSIRIDNIQAMHQMVDYLVSLGHTRIGVISGLAQNPHSLDRLTGYKASLLQHGIPFDANLVKEGDFTLWSGQHAMQAFFKDRSLPTAVVCMSDQMAFGAIQTIKAEGLKVPDDISVTGFDDIQYARYWSPALTTLAQPAEDIGRLTVDMLIRAIEGEDLSDEEIILPTHLVIRDSTSPPKPFK